MNIKYIEQTIVRDELDTIDARLLNLYHLYNDGSLLKKSMTKTEKISKAVTHISQLRHFLCEEG